MRKSKTKRASKRKTKLQKINAKYLKLYKLWKKIYCPALKKDIHFTSKGWLHIQKEKWRTRSEKEERLKLLSQAKHILSVSTTVQEKRLQKYHDVPHLHYGFTALVGGIKVSVVVVEDKNQFVGIIVPPDLCYNVDTPGVRELPFTITLQTHYYPFIW